MAKPAAVGDTARMTSTILVCTDGSELAAQAAAAGLAILQPADQVELVTVAEMLDPALAYDGSGHAGPTMSEAQMVALRDAELQRAGELVDEAAKALGLDPACGRVLEGDPGAAVCEYARTKQARAIVIGSRGRGGIKRALLGSVSDFVVRNAPCPVVVVGAQT
jgi:nucleotide-binding universal stress UspA family protein